ncbi:MAG: hypothetical protein QOD45_683, partial [Pseudonocardiales bacterium]|nr:hypothetical protein [Pseudonocardiales bacterium]
MSDTTIATTAAATTAGSPASTVVDLKIGGMTCASCSAR